MLSKYFHLLVSIEFFQILKNLRNERKKSIMSIQKFHSLGERLIMLKNMKNEYNRVKSFEHCDLRNSPSAKDLANAGMFYFGVENVTRCAFCFNYLKGWSKDDKPWKVHRKAYPECPHGNTDITGNHYNTQIETITTHPSAASFLLSPRGWRKRHDMDERFLTGMGIYTKFPYSCPEMINQETRFVTFKESIVGHIWRRQLAEAGFYYSITSDSVRCYMCDIGINTFTIHQGWNVGKSWSPFKPSELHMIGNPHCTHMILMKGKKWYFKMMKRLYDVDEEGFDSDIQPCPTLSDNYSSASATSDETESSASSSDDEEEERRPSKRIKRFLNNITFDSKKVCIQQLISSLCFFPQIYVFIFFTVNNRNCYTVKGCC